MTDADAPAITFIKRDDPRFCEEREFHYKAIETAFRDYQAEIKPHVDALLHISMIETPSYVVFPTVNEKAMQPKATP